MAESGLDAGEIWLWIMFANLGSTTDSGGWLVGKGTSLLLFACW